MSFAAPPLPTIVAKPRRGRVLVLAPHPDDETFGCGGTLLHHKHQGDPISAVFICSGIQGDPDGKYRREELPAIREKEARAAAAILGIRELTFFGYPDNLSDADYSKVFQGLPTEPDAQRRELVGGLAGRLAAIIEAQKATIVYHPWNGEVNGDHWAVAKAVDRIKETRSDFARGISWLGYEIWSASIPGTIVDVSSTFEQKLRAVAEYRSQLAYQDYVPKVRGLAAYRSLMLEKGATFGEAFVGEYLP
jgi:LmbE family N-acetylglucosaminyl deacetylase